jgi:hypothetical protein
MGECEHAGCALRYALKNCKFVPRDFHDRFFMVRVVDADFFTNPFLPDSPSTEFHEKKYSVADIVIVLRTRLFPGF